MDRPLQQIQDTLLLPVYSTDNRRPGESNPSGNPQTWEQAYINCYPEVYKDAVTGEPAYAVIKRPGLATGPVLTNTIASYGTGTTMECRANMVVSQLADVNVAAFWDSTASKIYILQYRPKAGTTIKIGELTSCTSTDMIFITEIIQQVGGTYPAGTATAAIAISYMKGDKTLGAGYYATSSSSVFGAGSLTAISSGSFPSNLGTPKVITGPFQQLDGTTYIMTLEGTIYSSGGSTGTLFDVTLWNTNGISTASQYPDQGVSVMRYKNVLLAFGADSIEFFLDAGLPPPGSPLERADQAFIKIGALSPKLIQNVDDTIYWVASGSNNTLGVWMLQGYTPVKISIPRIDYAISAAFATAPGPRNSMECLLLNHKKHLILNLGGGYFTTGYYDSGTIFTNADDSIINQTAELGAKIVAYNLDDRIWWGLAVSDSAAHTVTGLYPSVTFAAVTTGNYTQYVFTGINASNSDNTLVFTFKPLIGDDSYKDAFTLANPVCAAIQFNTFWFGTQKRKRINKASVLMNRVTQTGSDTNVYQFYMCFTKDDTSVTSGPQFGVPFKIPSTSNRYYINNLGECRNISFLIVSKNPASWRVLGLELLLDQKTS